MSHGRPLPGVSLYDVLQVPPTATDDEIRRAYRRLALRYHPDKNLGNQGVAAEQFKVVQHAYRILGDPRRRRLYDEYGSPGIAIADNLGEKYLWVLTSPWGRCLLMTFFLCTCCGLCCFCCCYCCCYFCCGLLAGPVVTGMTDSDMEAAVTSQPGRSSGLPGSNPVAANTALTEYSSLLGPDSFMYNAQSRRWLT